MYPPDEILWRLRRRRELESLITVLSMPTQALGGRLVRYEAREGRGPGRMVTDYRWFDDLGRRGEQFSIHENPEGGFRYLYGPGPDADIHFGAEERSWELPGGPFVPSHPQERYLTFVKEVLKRHGVTVDQLERELEEEPTEEEVNGQF